MTHGTVHIGLYVIFGIIMLPVYAMIIGWLLGKPRDFRTIAMTFGYMFGFIIALIISVVVMGTILSLVASM